MGDRGEDTYRVPSSTAQTWSQRDPDTAEETGTEAEITLEEEASWTVDMQPVHEGTLRTAAVNGSGRPPF